MRYQIRNLSTTEKAHIIEYLEHHKIRYDAGLTFINAYGSYFLPLCKRMTINEFFKNNDQVDTGMIYQILNLAKRGSAMIKPALHTVEPQNLGRFFAETRTSIEEAAKHIRGMSDEQLVRFFGIFKGWHGDTSYVMRNLQDRHSDSEEEIFVDAGYMATAFCPEALGVLGCDAELAFDMFKSAANTKKNPGYHIPYFEDVVRRAVSSVVEDLNSSYKTYESREDLGEDRFMDELVDQAFDTVWEVYTYKQAALLYAFHCYDPSAWHEDSPMISKMAEAIYEVISQNMPDYEDWLAELEPEDLDEEE